MSNKKINSVEWLYEQLTLTWYDYNSGKDLLEQAKAMHKEEIKDAYYNGGNYEDLTKNEILEIAEQFYTETFNSDEA